MSNTDHTPEPNDPISILKERKRLRDEEEARAKTEAAARAKTDEAERIARQVHVPELADQFLRGATELFELYSSFDRTDLKRASLAKVIDHEAAELEANQSPKPSWLRRLFTPTQATNYTELLYPTPVKERACWEISWVNLSRVSTFVHIMADVETGQLYSNPLEGGFLSGLKIDVLNREQLLGLTFDELSALIEHLNANIQQAQFEIKWAAMANEMPTDEPN